MIPESPTGFTPVLYHRGAEKHSASIMTTTLSKTIQSILLMLTLLLMLAGCQSQEESARKELSITYDKRTELLSLVSYLSGAWEYSLSPFDAYKDEVNTFFAPVKDHEAIQLLRKWRSDINYDAAMYYALKLDWSGSSIRIGSKVTEDPENRMSREQEEKLLEALNRFVQESRFEDFFSQHQELYDRIVFELRGNMEDMDMDWFSGMFQKDAPMTFAISASILNGPQNYSVSIPLKGGRENVTIVLGGLGISEDDSPYYDWESTVPIAVHEFSHAFCNNLNAQFWDEMKDQARDVFSIVQDKMERQAYGEPDYMMNETFVRAAAIRYMEMHYQEYDTDYDVKEETTRGFILTDCLLASLRNKEMGQDMRAYMPQICKDINGFDTDGYRRMLEEKARKAAHVTYCSIEDGSVQKPGTQTLVIRFDKPMRKSVCLYSGVNNETMIELAQRDPVVEWNKEMTELRVYLDLKPASTYGFQIHESWETQDGGNLNESVPVSFKTQE